MPKGIYYRTKRNKKHLSKSKTGKNNPMFGKHCSKEQKEKIKESTKGSKNHNWKGGYRKDVRGYIIVYDIKHPYKNLNNMVFEHRLIAEKYLGRYLSKEETIHHINGIKDDNRPENLYLFNSNNEHTTFEGLKIKPALISNLFFYDKRKND